MAGCSALGRLQRKALLGKCTPTSRICEYVYVRGFCFCVSDIFRTSIMIDQCHTLRVAAPPSCFSRRVGARKHSAIQPGTCLKHYGSVCIRTRGMNPAAVASDVDAASHAPVQQLESTQDELQSFDDLGVDQRLTVMLPENGVDEPSEIQIQAIPSILEGKTVAIQSFTGSGKTLAFLLPVMTMAVKRLESRVSSAGKAEDFGPEAIIVAPSRELAMQILRVAQELLPREAWPLVQQAIGGANMRRQLEAMKANKPLIVVGTPGRLAEHSRLGTLRTHQTAAIVIDEADQLLCQQFRDDMLRILSHCGRKLENGPQAVASSATMTPQLVADLSKLLGRKAPVTLVTPYADPLELNSDGSAAMQAHAPRLGSAQGDVDPNPSVPEWGWGQDSGFWSGRGGAAATRGTAGGAAPGSAVPSSLAPHVPHCYVKEVKRHHVDAVRRVIHALNANHVMVFMNHQDRLKDAMHKLRMRGMSVAVLHGEMQKQKRQAVMHRFLAGQFRVLLVSDVVARGLDMPDCDAVINLELPSNAGHYAHRAGRTGRMGRPGVVCTVIEKQHDFVIQKMCKNLSVDIMAARVNGGNLTVIRDGKVAVLGNEEQTEMKEPEPGSEVAGADMGSDNLEQVPL